MQQKGEAVTASEVFKNTHFASELDFKLFAISILALLTFKSKKGFKTRLREKREATRRLI